MFSQGSTANGETGDEQASATKGYGAESGTHTASNTLEEDDSAEAELQRAMIENYRNHTSQFYTQPEEVLTRQYHSLKS